MTTTRSRNLMEEADRKAARESIVSLATEMDAVSKITGKSRQEQEAAVKKAQESGQIRAAIDGAIAKGGKGVEDAYKLMYTAAGKGGAAFQSLTNDVFAMGRPSKENAKLFSLAGGEATQLLMQARTSARAGRAEEAKDLADRAATAFANQSKRAAITNLAEQGDATAIKIIESTRQNADSLNSLTSDLKGNLADRVKAEGFDPKSADGQKKMAELRNKEIKDEQGRGDAVTKGTIQLQNSLRDVSSGLISGLAKPLRDDGEVGKALKGFVKNLDATNVSPTMSGTRKSTEAMVDKVGQLLVGGGPGSKSQYQTAISDASKSGVLEKGDESFKKAFRDLGTMVQTEGKKGDFYREQIAKQAEAKQTSPEEYLKQVLQSDTSTIKQTIESLKEAAKESNVPTAPTLPGAKPIPGVSGREGSKEGIFEGALKELQKITVGGNIVDLAVQGAANIMLKGAIQGLPGAIPTPTPTVTSAPTPAVTPTPTPTVTQSPAVAAPMPERQTGSFGAIGKDIEDFGKGTLAMLHGKEGVITENRLSNLLDSAESSGLMKAKGDLRPESLKSIGDSIEKMMSEKFKMPDPSTMTADTAPTQSVVSENSSSFNSEVLSALNSLNKLMGQMLSVNQDMSQAGRQQLRATKSLSGDLYRSA